MDIFSHDFTISDADFHRLVQFIQQNYGIDLSKKRQLISSRLSHSLRELGYKDFRTFLEHLFSTRDPADLELVLNKLTTNYTFFLREQDHFAYFQDKILPELSAKHQRDQVLSIWSAGCSSGEEPYTLSICLKEFFGTRASQWDTRVLATDISQQALSKAMAGVYQPPADMPDAWLRSFNLMEPIRFRLKFDVIFCRNVMIYFDQPTRDALVRRFYDAMNPGAYLFISHSESLNQNPLFQTVAPAVYRKK